LSNKTLLAVIAVLSIAATTTSDAKPRHSRDRAAQATIVCNDRGCSDNVVTRRDQARPARVSSKASAITPKTRRVRAERVRVSRTQAYSSIVVCDLRGCSDRPAVSGAATGAGYTAATDAEPRRPRRAPAAADAVDANGNIEATIIGSRPAGCPHRFCGCEASLYLFGEIRPELNLAYNWIRKFPRTAPSGGMVAARSGHVMVLMSHVGGDEWLVHDGNSGGGRTRRHVRSIRGYVIVDPHGSRTAQYDTNRQ
jgi:hypothetical protein